MSELFNQIETLFLEHFRKEWPGFLGDNKETPLPLDEWKSMVTEKANKAKRGAIHCYRDYVKDTTFDLLGLVNLLIKYHERDVDIRANETNVKSDFRHLVTTDFPFLSDGNSIRIEGQEERKKIGLASRSANSPLIIEKDQKGDVWILPDELRSEKDINFIADKMLSSALFVMEKLRWERILAGGKTKPARKRKPLGKRASTIRQAIRDGKKGENYCWYLYDKKLETRESWQTKGCPKSYLEAYKDRYWKQCIWREKNNESRRLKRARQ